MNQKNVQLLSAEINYKKNLTLNGKKNDKLKKRMRWEKYKMSRLLILAKMDFTWAAQVKIQTNCETFLFIEFLSSLKN